MRPRYAAGTALVCLAGTLAGCGGGGSPGYALTRTQACFRGKGLVAVAQRNQVLPGSGGNLRVSLGPKLGMENIFIVFGRDSKEATAIEDRAVSLAEKSFSARKIYFPRSAILAGVELNRNVFYYSDSNAVSQRVRDEVAACLR